jgi:hypothetical protein
MKIPITFLQGGAVAACVAHNHEAGGSIPSPATNLPVSRVGERKATDTNFAASAGAGSSFFGGPRGEPDGDAQAVFPRGVLHYGARFLDRVLPSRRLAARFFLCPRKPRHAENCRGLRLVWLLVAAGSLR